LHRESQALLHLGAAEEARRPAREARAVYRRAGDRAGEADALRLCAHADQQLLQREAKEPQEQGDRHWRLLAQLQQAALSSAREACQQARQLPAKLPLGLALHTLSQAQAGAQCPEEALASSQEALEVFRQHGDRGAEASALVVQADTLMMQGDRPRATDAANAAAAIFRELGDAAGEAFAMGIFQEDADAGELALQPMAGGTGGPVESVQAARPKLDAVAVRKTVMEKALDILTLSDDDDGLFLDTPLMDAGLDSLSVISFRDSLQQEFPGINLPAEMTFDYPSVHAVATFICESAGAA